MLKISSTSMVILNLKYKIYTLNLKKKDTLKINNKVKWVKIDITNI